MPNMRLRKHFADGVFSYHTNSTGFRDSREFHRQRLPGTKRILVLGDSFTEGGCVNDGDRYTDLLSESLDVEVYNFGLFGTGTDQQYLIYDEIARMYEHDLVVVGVWVENIRRNISASRIHSDHAGRRVLTPKPYYELDDDALVLHNQPVPRPIPLEAAGAPQMDGVDPGTLGRSGLKGAAANVVTRLGPTPKRLVQRAMRWQPYPEYDDPAGDPWRLTRRILERWADESNTPVVVMPIPVYQYIERTASADAVRARFAELHDPPALYVHDPLPDLWSESKDVRRGFRFPNDHHFTPAGHRALANSLEPLLSRLIGLDLPADAVAR
jgi:lysophospholipase L1-like esterase